MEKQRADNRRSYTKRAIKENTAILSALECAIEKESECDTDVLGFLIAKHRQRQRELQRKLEKCAVAVDNYYASRGGLIEVRPAEN